LVDFKGGVSGVQNAVAFLHAQQLNMFAPENGPPAALVTALRHTGTAALPACRGAVDIAYAIDSTAFLITGWLANPSGKRTADWVAALDVQGNVLGTARSLRERGDLPVPAGKSGGGRGFETGFRSASNDGAADSDQPRPIRIVGMFPGARHPMCALPALAEIGPILIEPAAELRNVALGTSTAEAAGFLPWHGSPGAPGGGTAWTVKPGGPATGKIQFHVVSAGETGHAFALPFVTAVQTPPVAVSFTMVDGSRFEAQVPSLWARRGAWRAAVLPEAVVARHGGVEMVQLTAQDGEPLIVGSPLLVTLRPDWTKIF
jgi:hypothetical protein